MNKLEAGISAPVAAKCLVIAQEFGVSNDPICAVFEAIANGKQVEKEPDGLTDLSADQERFLLAALEIYCNPKSDIERLVAKLISNQATTHEKYSQKK